MNRPIALLLVASSLIGCDPPDLSNRVEPEPRPVPDSYECDPRDRVNPLATPVPGPSAPIPSPGSPDSVTVLRATFPNGSLICGYWDGIHAPPQPLQKGDGQVAGSDPTWTPTKDGLELAVTAPPSTTPNDEKTPSIGVFSTNLDFGPGTVFSVHATFQKPRILPDSGDPRAWAAGSVAARTGGKDDLKGEARLGVAVRKKGTTASLNITEFGKNGANFRQQDNKPIEGELYANIFEKDYPYTIALSVDRNTGKGRATLTSGSEKLLSELFDLTTFSANSELPTTAVGATLADCCVPDARVTVLLSNFSISQPGGRRRLPIKVEPHVPNRPAIAPH